MATTTPNPTQIQTRLALGDFLGSPQSSSQVYATPPTPSGFNLNIPTYSDMFGQDVSQVLGMLKNMYPAGTRTIQEKELAQQGQENAAAQAAQQQQFNQTMGYDYASLNSAAGRSSGGSGLLGNTATERSHRLQPTCGTMPSKRCHRRRHRGSRWKTC